MRACLLAAITLLFALQAEADAPSIKNYRWLVYSGDHPLAGKWGIHLDGSFRTLGASHWRQWVVRPGVNYAISRRVSVAAAYGHFQSYPDGLAKSGTSTPEHRLHQQVTVGQGAWKLALRHRVRFEERFFGPAPWRFQTRLRYMLRTDIPLKRFSNETRLIYLGLYDEVFMRDREFDQNRLFAAIGYRFCRTGAFEIGAFNQRYRPGTGRPMENNYVLVIGVSSSTPLKRLFRRSGSS